MSELALRAGAAALLVAAAYHVVLIFGPPAWAGFAGAPPDIVRSLEDGTWLAPASILAIAALLALMAGYGFSAAGHLPRLPLLRLGLWAIAALFLLRGSLTVPQALSADLARDFDRFHLIASAVVLAIGVAYLLGAIGLRRS